MYVHVCISAYLHKVSTWPIQPLRGEEISGKHYGMQ